MPLLVPFRERSPRGRFNLQCGCAVPIEGSYQEGDRESLLFGPLYSHLFVLDLSLLFRCVWGSCTCVLLGCVSGSMARRAGSRIRGVWGRVTSGRRCRVAWDAPFSPFRRFESELSKTVLTGYAARDLLPLSSSHTLACSKRRACALWVCSS